MKEKMKWKLNNKILYIINKNLIINILIKIISFKYFYENIKKCKIKNIKN